MKKLNLNNKNIDAVTELLKFALIVFLVCFLVVKAPQQVDKAIGIAGGLVLAAPKLARK
jgi:hypothetical protein